MDKYGAHDFEEEGERSSPLMATKRGGGAELGSLSTIKIARQTARTSNQRAATRRAAADEATIVRFREANHIVELLNLSPGGAMIASEIEPFIGEPIQIQIGDGLPVPAVARWIGGGRIGVEFGDHSLLVDQPQSADFTIGLGEAGPSQEAVDEPEAAEREPRQAVIRRAMVRSGSKCLPVRLCNISSHGVMLESDQCLAPGSAVQLEMAGGLLVSAEVRWSSGKRAGLSFDAEINTQGLGSLAVPPPTLLKPSYLDSEFDTNSPWAARFDRLTIRELQEPPEADAPPPSWQPPAR